MNGLLLVARTIRLKGAAVAEVAKPVTILAVYAGTVFLLALRQRHKRA